MLIHIQSVPELSPHRKQACADSKRDSKMTKINFPVAHTTDFQVFNFINPRSSSSDNGCFFKFGVEVGVELSIVNALYRLRITDQLFKSYAFTRMVRSQSTLQRLLRRQIKKKTPFITKKLLISQPKVYLKF
jgi:hypothetical protein